MAPRGPPKSLAGNQRNCFRFAYSASILEDQRPCGKELCSSSVEALVCLNFGSLASSWPRPWRDFRVPLGAGRLPKRSPDFQQTTPDDPNRVLGVPSGCLLGPGFPRGAGSLNEATQATQNGPPAAEACGFFENAPKIMIISPIFWALDPKP